MVCLTKSWSLLSWLFPAPGTQGKEEAYMCASPPVRQEREAGPEQARQKE